MYLVRRTPEAGSLGNLERTMDRMFGDFLGTAPATYAEFAPSLDVTETDDAYVVRAEVPGVAPADLQITVEDATLTLSGEKKADDVAKDGRWHRTERRYGRFTRSIEFPHAIDGDHVQASFKHGVVTVTLPKPEKVKARTVNVKVED